MAIFLLNNKYISTLRWTKKVVKTYGKNLTIALQKKRNKFNEHKFMTKFDPNRIFQSRNKDVWKGYNTKPDWFWLFYKDYNKKLLV